MIRRFSFANMSESGIDCEPVFPKVERFLQMVVLLRTESTIGDVVAFRAHCVKKLEEIKAEFGKSGYPDREVVVPESGKKEAVMMRALCATLDEVVRSGLSRNVGNISAYQPTQLVYCTNVLGAEQFYVNVDYLLKYLRSSQPQAGSEKQYWIKVETLRLYYFCMLSGFQGRLRGNEKERMEVINNIVTVLREIDKEREQVVFSPHWNAYPEEPKMRGLPWITMISVLAITVFVVFAIRYELDRQMQGHGFERILESGQGTSAGQTRTPP